jgi:hypothetical protein
MIGDGLWLGVLRGAQRHLAAGPPGGPGRAPPAPARGAGGGLGMAGGGLPASCFSYDKLSGPVQIRRRGWTPPAFLQRNGVQKIG